jgi:PTH1 family peptidyl-tRNA hydrolase
MKIIIGLGNPGKEYAGTRHNIGFEILDELQKEFNFSVWEFNKKFNAEISKGQAASQEIILVKPQTFMNLSGVTVRSILDFYKLTPADIFVIHDDIDIAIGTFKVATDSRSAGHNGVQNIIDQLGTQKFTRLRLGIGAETTEEPSCRFGAHDFVLGKFSETEKTTLEKIYSEITQVIQKNF